MAKENGKFKKVRLFKVAKDLNVTIDTVVDHLKQKGHAAALVGSGPNASITEEDAYAELLEAFASDKAHASRLKELRAAQKAEEEEYIAAQAEPPVDVRPEPVPEPPPPPAPVIEAPAPPAPEPVAEPEDAEAEPVREETAVPEVAAASEPPTVEPVAEAAPAKEAPVSVPATAQETPAEAETRAEAPAAGVEPATVETEAAAPPAEKAPTADKEATAGETAPAEETAEPASEIEAPEAEEKAAETPAEAAPVVPERVLTADRYQLAGTKVIGKIDLKTVDDASARTKRKRKRKRTTTEDAPATPAPAVTDDRSGDRAKKKVNKKKRGPSVDEADVTQTLQDTLRELEMGASRVRQRRRRQRRDERAAERQQQRDQESERDQVLRTTEFISTGELANLLDVPVTQIISTLFKSGMMVSINQRLDADTISFVADEFGHEVEFITEFGTDDLELEADLPEELEPRAPVVTVMGHVDHGKTSLLDHIRSANVVAGEAGGITQHIGAYHVELPDDRRVTFLDTPGHEAFTAMRARGASATDIVILVVAADDAVMPQTIEAINHARAAEVPIVVAINKIDKPGANEQRVMQQLADQGVLVEQYGGKVQCALVSAKTGNGVPELMERVLLESEILDLKANSHRNGVGTVIESRLEKGRGNVATVLVQNGTIEIGDVFVAGIHSGRIRAMFDERENRIIEVGPGRPALVVGFDGAPEVGDQFVVLDDERQAREIAQKRAQIHREQSLRQRKHITLDEIGRRLALGEFRELNLIIKADVGGSVEALSDALLKLSTEEVAVNIIHSGVGAVTESDVMLASASDAVIIGFQVRPMAGARILAEREEIDIRSYSIIYNAIEDVHDALEGLLSPEETERTIGVAEVRNTFKVPKAGTVAGCQVVEGRIHRNDKIRLVREGVVIYTGSISSLKRFKDDVREVTNGYECGLSIDNFNDLKVGDQIESFEIVETKRKLES